MYVGDQAVPAPGAPELGDARGSDRGSARNDKENRRTSGGSARRADKAEELEKAKPKKASKAAKEAKEGKGAE